MSIPVSNKANLFSLLTTHGGEIKAFGVKSLGLFGSFVRNEAKSDSDIDLLVDFHREKKTYDNFMDLGMYLETLLGRKVELITPQSLNKHIGPYILKEAENVPI